jgi:hypothetical protein
LESYSSVSVGGLFFCGDERSEVIPNLRSSSGVAEKEARKQGYGQAAV